MKNNRTLVLISPTPYGSTRLWFAPEFENVFSKISIWGGVDSRDKHCGTVSVEIDSNKVPMLESIFPGFQFTDNSVKAMELWGIHLTH